MEPTKSSNKNLGIGISIAVIIIIALIVIFVGKSSSSSTSDGPANPNVSATTPVSDQSTTQASSTAMDTNTSSVYKDGTYTATGSYMSPGGQDQIGVTLTIKNDIITSASVVPMPGDHMSAKYQQIFATNYTSYVVGQNIGTLNLTKVSGSSLTPGGFDDALAQIKTQAKA